jgi:hypothetical protein
VLIIFDLLRTLSTNVLHRLPHILSGHLGFEPEATSNHIKHHYILAFIFQVTLNFYPATSCFNELGGLSVQSMQTQPVSDFKFVLVPNVIN